MGLMLWSNNAKTTLAGSIASDVTTVNLASGSGALFPNPTGGNYFAMTFVDAATKLISEIVYATARSGDAVTIVRGQEGTTARAWAAGDIASNLWTAGAAALGAQPPTLQAQAGNYAVDSGTANAVVVSFTPAPPTLADIKQGTPFRIKKSGAANTGAVTIAVNGLAAAPLVHADGTAIGAAELPASGVFSSVFDGTNFVLQSNAATAGGVTATQLQTQGGNYAADTGTANAAAITLAPVPANLAALGGVPIRIKKVASNNTGAITLVVNGLTATPIKLTDGTDPLNAMLQASAIFSVIYDGTNFELQSPPAGLAPLNAPALVNPTATTPVSPTDNTQKVATTQWVNAAVQAAAGGYAVDSPVNANSVAITLTPTPASYAALVGVPIRVMKGPASNGSAVVINVNGLGTRVIVLPGNKALIAGAIPANSIFTIIYDGTSFELQSPPAAPYSTTFTSAAFSLNSAQYGSYALSAPLAAAVAAGAAIFPTLVFICTSTDNGWAAGDTITTTASTGSGTGRGYSVGYDASTAYWSRDPNGISVQSKTGGYGTLDLTKWNAQIRLLAIL